MPKLKPCPFCGSEAIVQEMWADCGKKPYAYQVMCKSDEWCGVDIMAEKEEDAILNWNKRTDENSALRAELDEIRRSYKEIVDGPCGADMLHCACVPALRAKIEALRAEAEKDYADMRQFQAKFIEADHDRIALRAEVERLNSAPAECLHCGDYSPDKNHWRTCKDHPASKLLAEVERLQRPDGYFEQQANHFTQRCAEQGITIAEQTHIMEQLRADLAAAVEVLRPVASLLQKHHDNYSDERIVFAINRKEITVGVLRKARALLARLEVKK